MSRYRTPDDYHKRRAGEPLGYLPEVGDRIRFAMRHDPWDSAAKRMRSYDEHDEQGEWEYALVLGVIGERVRCRPDGDHSESDSYIDRDWWLIEHVERDGALW